MVNPPTMAKEQTHSERMAQLAGDIANPKVVAACDKALQDIALEWRDVLGLRALAASRHGDTSAPPVAPAGEVGAGQVARPSADEPTRGITTISNLIDAYKSTSEPRSKYHRARFHTRRYYDALCRRLVAD